MRKRKLLVALVCLIVAIAFTSCSKMWEDLDFNYGDDDDDVVIEYPIFNNDTIDVPINNDTIDAPVVVDDDFELWKERVTPIVEGCVTDYEKAKAIFEWECANIAYDLDFRISNAYDCWEQKKGVCQAYSELYVKLAWGCALEARLVSGKAKNAFSPDGEGGHAWVRANTEKGWILMDPTWSAGGVSMDLSTFVFNDHDMTWFETDPSVMIFTHFPSTPEDQLLPRPLTESMYKRLPVLRPDVTFVGFDGTQVLDYFLRDPDAPFPRIANNCWQLRDRVKLIEVPMDSDLKVGEIYTFKIQCLDSNLVISSCHNWEWEDWEKEGDIYTKVLQPTSEILQWSNSFQIATHETIGDEENRIVFLFYTFVE